MSKKPTKQAVAIKLVEKLSKRYTILDPKRTIMFIHDHPDVGQELLHLPPHIEEHFGKGQPLQIDMLWDPDDGTWSLMAYILCTGEWKEAWDRRNAFNEWWIYKTDRPRGGLMLVDITFLKEEDEE